MMMKWWRQRRRRNQKLSSSKHQQQQQQKSNDTFNLDNILSASISLNGELFTSSDLANISQLCRTTHITALREANRRWIDYGADKYYCYCNNKNKHNEKNRVGKIKRNKGLYIQLQQLEKFIYAPPSYIYEVTLYHLLNPNEVHKKLRDFNYPYNHIQSVTIKGPDCDEIGTYGYGKQLMHEDGSVYPEGVSDKIMKQVFMSISGMPRLRELLIVPSYYSHDANLTFSSKRICWLLSSQRRTKTLETLRVAGIELHNQSEVQELGIAITSCTSLQNICIEPLVVYEGVNTLRPLTEAMANHGNLTKLRFVINGIWEHKANYYLNESIRIFNNGTGKVCRGLRYKPPAVVMIGNHQQATWRELSNCDDLHATI